jgi:hypothetical protein
LPHCFVSPSGQNISGTFQEMDSVPTREVHKKHQA